VPLDASSAALFEQAASAGELVIPADLPVSSPLPAAWKACCQQNGRPCLVREEGPP